jgi:mannosyltransferase OCH1-like enzyme
MPDTFARFIREWRTLHPNWTVKVWGDDDLRWLANRATYDQADALAGDHAGQFRSDIARYEILHRFGGVYVDCDMEPRRPIDELMNAELFAAWETDGKWVNNAVIGSKPGHPLLASLIRELPSNVARNRGKRPNHMTGPRFLTPQIRNREDVTLHPSSTFYPYRWDELDRRHDDHGDAYAVHHWSNAHRRAGLSV